MSCLINGDPAACYRFENNWYKLDIDLVLLLVLDEYNSYVRQWEGGVRAYLSLFSLWGVGAESEGERSSLSEERAS